MPHIPIENTAGWAAAVAAKAAWAAEVGVSGKDSFASRTLAKVYIDAMKVCTEQAKLDACW